MVKIFLFPATILQNQHSITIATKVRGIEYYLVTRNLFQVIRLNVAEKVMARERKPATPVMEKMTLYFPYLRKNI